MKYFFFLFIFLICSVPLFAKPSKRKLIVLSIDGFPGYYADKNSGFYKITPNLNELETKSNFSNSITSIYPTMTYPAHTSMISGVDSEIHNIRFNSPVDPFGKNHGGWMWYYMDIHSRTIFDYAKDHKKKTASVYWPVTVGADIDFHIPQYWRAKNLEDEKLLRILSTKGLYDELKTKANIHVSEITPDIDKLKAALYIWKTKRPDVLFIYTTDLDSAHHSYGIYSEQAKQKLITIDALIKELIFQTELYSTKNLSLIVVSDHGFKEIKSICYPNSELKLRGLFSLEKEIWKFYFKTNGGISVLIQNDDFSDLNFGVSELKNLKDKIESNCKATKFIYEGKNFEKLKRKFHSKAKAFLYSTGDTGFSDKVDEPLFKNIEKPFSNHGFLPGDPAMKTILISYPKKKDIQLKSIKDVFKLSCNWLKIQCDNNLK